MPKFEITIIQTYNIVLDTGDYDEDYVADISTDGEIDPTKFASQIHDDVESGDLSLEDYTPTSTAVTAKPEGATDTNESGNTGTADESAASAKQE